MRNGSRKTKPSLENTFQPCIRGRRIMHCKEEEIPRGYRAGSICVPSLRTLHDPLCRAISPRYQVSLGSASVLAVFLPARSESQGSQERRGSAASKTLTLPLQVRITARAHRLHERLFARHTRSRVLSFGCSSAITAGRDTRSQQRDCPRESASRDCPFLGGLKRNPRFFLRRAAKQGQTRLPRGLVRLGQSRFCSLLRMPARTFGGNSRTAPFPSISTCPSNAR